jgi:three-Cys-motif partner protein
MVTLPPEYERREQTFLKHRVLDAYLEKWLYKMAFGQPSSRLWFVDCFAGPWEDREPKLQDTSFAKALAKLNEVAEDVRRKHPAHTFSPHAVFVENNPKSCARLKSYVKEHRGLVQVKVFEGTFGDHVPALSDMIGHDPALIFIDPTGWKGADMRFIAPLAAHRHRDVLVNVMIQFINRFKAANHSFIEDQMKSFFGLEDASLPAEADEERLMALYRTQLKNICDLKYTADLIVPIATKDRTQFRLVVGAHHHAALELFRVIEAEVCGRDAASVRTQAKDRQRQDSTGQPLLLPTPVPQIDDIYATLHELGRSEFIKGLPRVLAREERLSFREIWTRAASRHHLRRADINELVRDVAKHGQVVIHGLKPRERKIKDDHIIALPQHRSTPQTS